MELAGSGGGRENGRKHYFPNLPHSIVSDSENFKSSTSTPCLSIILLLQIEKSGKIESL